MPWHQSCESHIKPYVSKEQEGLEHLLEPAEVLSEFGTKSAREQLKQDLVCHKESLRRYSYTKTQTYLERNEKNLEGSKYIIFAGLTKATCACILAPPFDLCRCFLFRDQESHHQILGM